MTPRLDRLDPFGDMLDFFAGVGAADWVWSYLEACARVGVFHSDPWKCILARPVDSSLPIEYLNALVDICPDHPEHAACMELTKGHDAWHIIYASGDIRGFFDLATIELPKLIWQRNGTDPVRIYNFNSIRNKVMGAKKPKEPKAPKAPDPATIATGVDDLARKQAELERRRRGGFYSGFRSSSSDVGGANETVG